jgi:hypothetical protein
LQEIDGLTQLHLPNLSQLHCDLNIEKTLKLIEFVGPSLEKLSIIIDRPYDLREEQTLRVFSALLSPRECGGDEGDRPISWLCPRLQLLDLQEFDLRRTSDGLVSAFYKRAECIRTLKDETKMPQRITIKVQKGYIRQDDCRRLCKLATHDEVIVSPSDPQKLGWY